MGAKLGIMELLLAFMPLVLVGLSAWSFVKYSKTKQASWAVLGAISGALFILIVIAALVVVNEKPWQH